MSSFFLQLSLNFFQSAVILDQIWPTWYQFFHKKSRLNKIVQFELNSKSWFLERTHLFSRSIATNCSYLVYICITYPQIALHSEIFFKEKTRTRSIHEYRYIPTTRINGCARKWSFVPQRYCFIYYLVLSLLIRIIKFAGNGFLRLNSRAI